MSRKKTDNRKTEQQIAKGITAGIKKIISFYAVLILAVFPVFITNMYYNCLRDKYYFFFYSTAALAGVILFLYLAGLAMGAFRKVRLRDIFGRLTVTDILVLVFLGAVSVSTLLSEWKYESFWGNMGRLQGMFFYILIVLSYFIVTRGYKFRKWHFIVFLSVGIIINLWGFADYFGIDPLGWRADANDYQGMLIFSSTIGNVNTYTAVAAFYFGMSAYLAAKLDRPALAYASFFVSCLGLIGGQSDNAVLAVGSVMAILPFVIFENRKGILRYLILLSVFFASLSLTGILTPLWTAAPVLPDYMWGVLITAANKLTRYCIIAACAFAALSALFSFLWRKKTEKKSKIFRIIWGVVCAAVLCALLYAFIDANSGKHEELWAPYANIFVFSDAWGTNRGFAWKHSFEFIRDFSFIKKLFGSGPETFAIFMAKNFYYEMLEFMDAVFDSPHSEPLQILFTTGIIGFAAYYGAFVTAAVRGLKKGKWAGACVFAFIAFLFASIINISVPITTPLLFLFAELASTIGDEDEEKI